MKLVEAMDKSPFGMAYAVANKILVGRPPQEPHTRDLLFIQKGLPNDYITPFPIHWTLLESAGYTDMNWMPVTGICTIPNGGDSFEV
jgi:hypothetical protein